MGYPSYDLTLEQYSDRVLYMAFYPNQGSAQGLVYAALGLAGESGEVAEKVKKMLRDDAGVLTPARRESLLKELGDVLWYISACAREAGSSLDEVARINIDKLESRKEKGTLSGSGDSR